MSPIRISTFSITALIFFAVMPSSYSAESIGGSTSVDGNPFLSRDIFGNIINPDNLVGFATNLAIAGTGSYSVQRSEGPGFASASLSVSFLGASGRVRATGGNDYNARAFVSIGVIRERLRIPDLPLNTSGYFEGAFQLNGHIANTFRNAPLEENGSYVGGSSAWLNFGLIDQFGNPLPKPGGGNAFASKIVNPGKHCLYEYFSSRWNYSV